MRNVMSEKAWKVSSVVIGVLLLGLVVGVEDALADEEIVAKVPFAFIVGNAHFAPGNYIVRSATEDPAVMEIVSTDRTEAVLALTMAASPERGDPRPGLVFTKVGNDYVLARLVTANGDDREFVVPARREAHDATGAAR
jgi:hypothetical protein